MYVIKAGSGEKRRDNKKIFIPTGHFCIQLKFFSHDIRPHSLKRIGAKLFTPEKKTIVTGRHKGLFLYTIMREREEESVDQYHRVEGVGVLIYHISISINKVVGIVIQMDNARPPKMLYGDTKTDTPSRSRQPTLMTILVYDQYAREKYQGQTTGIVSHIAKKALQFSKELLGYRTRIHLQTFIYHHITTWKLSSSCYLI